VGGDVSPDAAVLGRLLRGRRSIRDFEPRPVPPELLRELLDEAVHAPSWSNTQPYRLAVATGPVRDRLARELPRRYDEARRLQRAGALDRLRAVLTRRGLPDFDFDPRTNYPPELLEARRRCGFGLYARLGIAREDHAARERQMRRNYEFFGAPCALFVFVHAALGPYAALDAGFFLQSLALAAHARGLGTCVQGALALFAGPLRREFAVPEGWKLLCGVALGWPSAEAVNGYDPGRAGVDALLLPARA
jgi:nitroreductase